MRQEIILFLFCLCLQIRYFERKLFHFISKFTSKTKQKPQKSHECANKLYIQKMQFRMISEFRSTISTWKDVNTHASVIIMQFSPFRICSTSTFQLTTSMLPNYCMLYIRSKHMCRKTKAACTKLGMLLV